MHSHLELFTTWLHANPQWGGIAACVIALAESVAILGTIIPGSITMTAIGILVGSGILPVFSTLLFAIFGALLGDSISYATGYYFKDRMTRLWPFSRYPEWLQKGQHFFDKHGGKSVFFGRFIGPIRAMIPIIAGMLHMRAVRFFPIDMAAAIIWAPLYLFPGYLVGVAAIALPASVATRLVLSVLGLLIAVWLFIWLLSKTSDYFSQLIDYLLATVWKKLSFSRLGRAIRLTLKNANHPEDPGQLLLSFACLMALFLFLWTFASTFYHGILYYIDGVLYHFFRGLRTAHLDHIVVAINFLGARLTLLPVIALVFAWLLFRKRRSVAIHWLVACFFTIAVSSLVKLLHFSPRPTGIQFISDSSSFPSNQLALACTFYGLLAWFIGLEKPHWKKIVYKITAFMILLIMAAQLYLGYHWFTDLIGGFFLGTTISTAMAIAYQRRLSPPPQALELALISTISLAIAFAVHLHLDFKQQLLASRPIWPHQVLSTTDWWQKRTQLIPIYRTTRFGYPAELLNVQWAGEINQIRELLIQQGFTQSRGNFAHVLLKELQQEKKLTHLNFLPVLYADQRPILVMTKAQDKNHAHDLVLRLWPSNISLAPQNWVLWIGTFNGHQRYQLISAETATRALNQVLTHTAWKMINRPADEIPAKLLPTSDSPHYILLIKPK